MQNDDETPQYCLLFSKLLILDCKLIEALKLLDKKV